jgi:hypothetical protein
MQAANEFVIASGTAQQLCTSLSSPTRYVTRLIIQCQPAAGDGLIYVFNGVPIGVTPTISTFPYITLAAGSAAAGSDEYDDRLDTGDTSNIDLCRIWIDGSHTGDVVTFSPNVKV